METFTEEQIISTLREEDIEIGNKFIYNNKSKPSLLLQRSATSTDRIHKWKIFS